ncbi:hypothetical protein NHX12_032871 [Muraenolepis orangiensis]|uniref:Elongation factor 1-delta n=1 Tax=Muraenolepis orangiensis TaxID=630683 RepID=A0A9Q0E4G3_9TELE|nr:hypothetical protein NHX12_032871 [Muraenolepis orangiensis]
MAAESLIQEPVPFILFFSARIKPKASRRTPSKCTPMDRSERAQSASHCQMDASTKAAVEGRKKSESGQGNGEAVSSSPESGSLNGEGKRPAKTRRRRKRSSNPETRPEAKAGGSAKEEGQPGAGRSAAPCAALLGLRSETASVWLERSVYERAEGRYQCWLALSDAPAVSPPQAGRCPGKKSKRPPTPDSLSLALPAARPATPATPATPLTPDEGYQSRQPTPATPINGLPRLAAELLREVWLEKPLYDRAEAAFYQHLYGNSSNCSSSPKWANSYGASRSGDHPQSLVEEEEEDEGGPAEEEVEEEEEEENNQVVPQGKAEVFHALHSIQEEEEPAEVCEEQEASAPGIRYFLHPDSERVWLDKWRYDAAESRLHCQSVGAATTGARRPGRKASPVASSTPQRDNNTMSAVDFFAQDKIWFDKPRYDEAERRFYEQQSGPSGETQLQDAGANSILQDIARARENIQKSLAGMKTTLCNRGSGHRAPNLLSQLTAGTGSGDQGELASRMKSLELENQSLHKVVEDLRSALSKLESRVAVLERSPAAASPASSAPCTNGTAPKQQKISTPEDEDDDADDDFELFGDEEEDDGGEAERIKEQRLKEYAERKAKKPALIAKSSILLDVKPWDDETDMVKLEECVRSVQADGLLWGASKLVAVGYGIRKLQISCVVEDDKVGTDLLEEEITKFEDYIQSVDIAAFNKI